MSLSKGRAALVCANEKGYRVQSDGSVVGPKGRPLKLRIDSTGYPSFCIRLGRERFPISVHRLAGYQIFGDSYLANEEMVVRHLDGDPTNNSWSNLAIGTQTENMMDMPAAARRQKAVAASCNIRAATDEQVAAIRARRADGLSYNALVREFGFAKSTIREILIRNYVTTR